MTLDDVSAFASVPWKNLCDQGMPGPPLYTGKGMPMSPAPRVRPVNERKNSLRPKVRGGATTTSARFEFEASEMEWRWSHSGCVCDRVRAGGSIGDARHG